MADLITRRSTLAPASIDAEARTAEVVWSTGAGVRRRDLSGPYEERLSLAPDAVDLSRLIGASVLDAHRQDAVRDVLGTVRGPRSMEPRAWLWCSSRPGPRWSRSGRTL